MDAIDGSSTDHWMGRATRTSYRLVTAAEMAMASAPFDVGLKLALGGVTKTNACFAEMGGVLVEVGDASWSELRTLLEKHGAFQVIGEAEDGRSAVKLVEQLHPDIVVMDIAMKGLNGIEAAGKALEGPLANLFGDVEHGYDAVTVGGDGKVFGIDAKIGAGEVHLARLVEQAQEPTGVRDGEDLRLEFPEGWGAPADPNDARPAEGVETFKLMATTRQAEKANIPRRRFRSRANKDSKANNPRPGQPNTDSTTTEPPSNPPTCTPAMVTTGRTAFRKICLKVMRRSVRPFAFAVVT